MLIVGTVNYWLLLPSACMMLLFYLIRRVYVNTGRSIKRLEALSKIFRNTLGHLFRKISNEKKMEYFRSKSSLFAYECDTAGLIYSAGVRRTKNT